MIFPEDQGRMSQPWVKGRMRRGVLTGVDQGVSSATNFALAVVIARTGSSADFGAYTLAITGFALCIALVRAAVADPLMVAFSAKTPPNQKTAARSAVSAAILLSIILAGFFLLVATFLQGEAQEALRAMGIVLAGVILQDTLRFVWFSAASVASAVINDALWMVFSVAAYSFLVFTGHATMPNLILAWGATGSICFFTGLVLLHIPPTLTESLGWLRAQRTLGMRFAGEVAIDGSFFELGLILIGSIAGLAQLGIVFGGRLLLAPVNVLFMGMTAFAIPEGVRLRESGLEKMDRLIVACAVSSLLAVASWSLLCLVIPANLGEAFFGDVWVGARSVLLPTAIGVAAFGVAQSARSGLRALADARRSLRARAIGAPGFVVFGTVGAVLDQGRGAAWGLALAFCGLGVLMWRAYRVSLAEALSEEGSPGKTPR